MSSNTDIKSIYLSKIDERIRGLNGHAGDLSNQLRLYGREVFEKTDFPTRKDEDYKYTSFNTLLKEQFEVVTAASDDVTLPETFDAYTFVFVDGVLVSSPDEVLPAGLFAGTLSSAWENSELQTAYSFPRSNCLHFTIFNFAFLNLWN